MVTLGKYELILQRALEQVGPGPWLPQDLGKTRDLLTHELCLAVNPDCDPDAVFDWLKALPEEDIPDLMQRLNANRFPTATEEDDRG